MRKTMYRRISFLLVLVMAFAMLAMPVNAVSIEGGVAKVSDAEVDAAIAESATNTVGLDFSGVNETFTGAEISAAALAKVEATGKAMSVFNGMAYLEVNHAALSTIVAQTGDQGTVTLAFELLPMLNLDQMAVMDQMLAWFATSITHNGKQLDVGTDGSITVIIPEAFVGAVGADAYSVAMLDEKGKFHVVETKSENGNLVAVLTELAVYAVIEKTEEPAAPEIPFTDVSENDWFKSPVLWALENNVTSGYSDKTFRPYNNCTRAEVVTFLYAAAGKPEVKATESVFTDVKASDWYFAPVMWAVENGITSGYSDKTFRPYNNCTRAEVVTFLYAANGKIAPEATESTFGDVKASDWYFAPVMWAKENGITSGYSDNTFRPGNNCTRAEVVTFLSAASKLAK